MFSLLSVVSSRLLLETVLHWYDGFGSDCSKVHDSFEKFQIVKNRCLRSASSFFGRRVKSSSKLSNAYYVRHTSKKVGSGIFDSAYIKTNAWHSPAMIKLVHVGLS